MYILIDNDNIFEYVLRSSGLLITVFVKNKVLDLITWLDINR